MRDKSAVQSLTPLPFRVRWSVTPTNPQAATPVTNSSLRAALALRDLKSIAGTSTVVLTPIAISMVLKSPEIAHMENSPRSLKVR